MKWTKFKDNTPKIPYVYVTNFYSTWFSYQLFGDWKDYAIRNPEYAWAEIPAATVPIEPKGLHECKTYNGITCIESPDGGGLLVSTSMWSFSAIYCPFCGYSIQYKGQNPFNNPHFLITNDDFIKNLSSIDLPKMKHV